MSEPIVVPQTAVDAAHEALLIAVYGEKIVQQMVAHNERATKIGFERGSNCKPFILSTVLAAEIVQSRVPAVEHGGIAETRHDPRR